MEGVKPPLFAHPFCGTFKYAAVKPEIGAFFRRLQALKARRGINPRPHRQDPGKKRPEILCRHLPGAGVLAFAGVSPYSKKLFALVFLTPVIGILYLSAK